MRLAVTSTSAIPPGAMWARVSVDLVVRLVNGQGDVSSIVGVPHVPGSGWRFVNGPLAGTDIWLLAVSARGNSQTYLVEGLDTRVTISVAADRMFADVSEISCTYESDVSGRGERAGALVRAESRRLLQTRLHSVARAAERSRY